jgi:hypothetical protein
MILISLHDQSFFDCVIGKIIKSYDLEFILNDTKFKPVVNQLIQECKGSTKGWSKNQIDSVMSYIKPGLSQKIGRDLTKQELECIEHTLLSKFESPEELNFKDDRQMTLVMQSLINQCLSFSSWTPEILKQVKDTISTELYKIGERNTDEKK